MFPYNMARNFQPTPTTFIHEQYKVCYRWINNREGNKI
jgi:hypothetical protein